MNSNRDTLFVEEAEILAHEHYAGDQHLLRLHAPAIAAKARAGSFVHVTCDPSRPLRRPISLLRVDARAGWIELMYKVFGEGTRLLSQRRLGEQLSVLGPIGVPFTVQPEQRRPLLIGGGIGMPPMLYLADELRQRGGFEPLVILGSEVPFPFQARPSTFIVPGIPAGVTAAVPLLEDWGIASRLCSLQGYTGCHSGYVTDLARLWLETIGPEARQQVAVFACGPHPMLEAVAALARAFDLPCQVSMEEFMACGVGGCAGCTIEVQTPQGTAMKRVCVDGPVFDAGAVFPG